MSSVSDSLCQRIGYTFRQPKLLHLALTHPSWLQDHPEESASNQRLEFLGDAVLQLVLTVALFERFPAEREGDLSKRRAALTNGTYLARLAREISLGEALKLSESEDTTGGRTRESALEDAFEALLGAIFEDGGFTAARDVIMGLYGDLPDRLDEVIDETNPKGRLQERVQPHLGNDALRYEVTHAAGEDHAREYEAEVFLQDQSIGRGRGSSKKSAEEAAARQALGSKLVPPAT
jgi:ribonuclease III